MGGTCGRYGEEKKRKEKRCLVKNLKEMNHLVDLDVDERTILKCVTKIE